MKIRKEVYTKLLNCPSVPPESGGIIGCDDGQIITHFIFDKADPGSEESLYVPNVEFLNSSIQKWHEKGIQFIGIFHSHALQWDGLSNADKAFIITIMQAMPAQTDHLWFPLVFPGSHIKAYVARKHGDEVLIDSDAIEII